jgi:fructose-1,6-bisphosphatase/inositol monophosphatase family enzyme
MFTASKGQGAYLNEQRIRTTHTRGFENTLIGTGFPFKAPRHLDAYLVSRPEKSPIKPPASLTKSAPAAMSQMLSSISQKPSKRQEILKTIHPHLTSDLQY